MTEAPRKSPGRRPFLVWRLVWADIRHEWLLSLCMILAIASILAPLLILFGLKYGTVETFRQRLLGNPRNLEIRPLTSRPYKEEWFNEVRTWLEVSFVVPHTRQMSASLDAYSDNATAPVSLDVIPSGPGDPWLAAANIETPGNGAAVISVSAAEALGVAPGDKLKVAAKRLQGPRVERGDTELLITAVFSTGGPESRAIFTTLDFLEKVEAYKDGRSVPELGWPGETPAANPIFSAALIIAPEKLSPTVEFKSINNTGFVSILAIDGDKAGSLLGRPEAPPGEYYLLGTKGEAAGADNIIALYNIFRGTGTEIYPLAKSLAISLACAGGDKIVVPDSPLSVFGGPEKLLDTGQASGNWMKIKMEAGQCPPGETRLIFNGQGGTLSFPVMLEEAQFPLLAGYAAMPPLLLGTLAQADRRALIYEAHSRAFITGRRSYAGFRLYAKTLENVAPLQKKFEALGLAVSAESARIEEMQRLDKYLTLIFWLISVTAIIGASASLLSNIYAGLERKRRELGVLRLLGFSGFTFLRFPLYSSILLAGGGFLGSWLLFQGLSAVINNLFSDHLQPGENLCRLTLEHTLTALAISLTIAALAGTLAARRAARIEAAEALRDE